MKQTLTLNYTIPTGDLRPYFDALATGTALASRCSGCDKLRFPPRLNCCPGSNPSWHRLGGGATVLARTSNGFALVRFDGADCSAVTAIANPAAHGRRGQLCRPRAAAPGLWIELDVGGDPKDV